MVRGFKMEMSDAQRVVDVYSAIAATTASSTEELAVAMSKTASSLESVGASFESSTAMISTMIAVTREAPENIGSALKSIVSRYGEMKSDPTALVDSEGEAMSFNKVDTALKSIGISIKDANNQFRDFDDVILELGEKWDTLDKNAQRYIATIMAGNRQQSRFLALVGNIDQYKEALETANDSEDAATLQTLKTMDSLESKINQMHVAMQEFYTSSGIESWAKGVVTWVTQIIEVLNDMPKAFGKIPVSALMTVISVIQVIKGLLTNVIAEVVAEYRSKVKQLEDEASSNGQRTGEGMGQAFYNGIRKWFVKADADSQKVGSGTLSGTTNSTQQQASISNQTSSAFYGVGRGLQTVGMAANIIATIVDKSQQTKQVITGIGTALSGVGSILTGNYILGAIQVISGIVTTISGAIETSSEKIERLNKAAEESANKTLVSKNEYKTLADYKNKLDELTASRYESDEAYQEWLDLNNEIADKYPSFISSIDSESNKIVSLTGNYQKLLESKRQAFAEDWKDSTADKLELYDDMPSYLDNLGLGGYGKEGWRDLPWDGGDKQLREGLQYIVEGLQNEVTDLGGFLFDNKILTTKLVHNVDAGFLSTFAGNAIQGGLFTRQEYNEKYGSSVMGDSGDLINYAYHRLLDGVSIQEIEEEIRPYAGENFSFEDGFLESIQALISVNPSSKGAKESYLRSQNLEAANEIAQSRGLGAAETEVFQQNYLQDWTQYMESRNLTYESSGEELAEAMKDFYLQSVNNVNDYLDKTILLLTDGQEKLVDEIYNKRSKYSSTAYQEALQKIGINQDFVDRLVTSQREEIQKERESATEKFKALGIDDSLIEQYITNFGTEYYDDIADMFSFSNNIEDDQLKGTISGLQQSVLSEILLFDDPNEQIQAMDILQSGDLTSMSGWLDVQQKLHDAGITALDEITDQIIAAIPSNLALDIDTYRDKLYSQFDDYAEAMKKIYSGFDPKEAIELAQKMGIELEDMDFHDGQYFLKPEDYEKYKEVALQPFKEYTTAIQGRIDRINEGESLTDKENQQIIDYLNANDVAVDGGGIIDDNGDQILVNGQLTEEQKQAYVDAVTAELEAIGKTEEEIEEYWNTATEIHQGNILSVIKSADNIPVDLTKDSEKEFWVAVAQGDEALQQFLADRKWYIEEQYLELIKNSSPEQLTDFKAIDERFKQLTRGSAFGYEDEDGMVHSFINQMEGENGYAQFLIDNGVEKGSRLYNKLVAEWYEETADATVEGWTAAANAVKDLSSVSTEDLVAMFNAGVFDEIENLTLDTILNNDSLRNIDGSYNLRNNPELREAIIEAAKNGNKEAQDLVADMVIESLKTQQSYYKSATSGTLTNTQRTDWQEILKENGSTIDLVDITYQTKEGLKLTREGRILMAQQLQSDATNFENLGKAYKETASAISSASDGFDIDKAMEISRETGILLTEMTEREGKFYITGKENREKFYQAQIRAIEEEKTINNQQAQEIGDVEALNFFKDNNIHWQDYSEDVVEAYQIYMASVNAAAAKEQRKVLEEQMQLWAVQDFDLSSLGLTDVGSKAAYQAAARGEQELRSFLASLGIPASEAVIDAIMDTANGTARDILSMFSDADVGATIDISSVIKGTPWENIFGDNTSFTNKLKDYRNAVMLVYGNDQEAFNQAMAEGISKYSAHDNQAINAAATLLENAENISIDTLNSIASALGWNIEFLMSFLGAKLQANGNYRLTDMEAVNKVISTGVEGSAEVEAQYADFINTRFSNINSLISSALEGSLDSSGQLNLLNLLKETGFSINEEDFKSMFIETKKGLQMSKQAAYELYSQMKETNELAAKTTLDALVASAKEVDSSLGDIYKVEEKIAELNEKLKNDKLSDSRKKQLEAELDIAKQIRKELLAAGKAYNFMDRDLPTGETNPISAWEGAASAMDVLNGDDFKDGYMQVEDFRNMIDFMGTDILNSAGIFTDNMQTADDLILAGYSALKNIDGKQMVDLSALGTQFKLGADGMAKGVTEGIHQLARSQIEILDAEIKMLETIVQTQEAFENIDSDNSGEIDLSEFMPHISGHDVDGYIYEWNSDQKTILDNMVSTLGENFTVTVTDAAGKTTDLTLAALSDPNIWKRLSKEEQQSALDFINNYWQATESIEWSDLGNGENFDKKIELINRMLATQGKKLADGIDSSVFTDKLIDTSKGEGVSELRKALNSLFGDESLAGLDLSDTILQSFIDNGQLSPTEILNALLKDEKIDEATYNNLMTKALYGLDNENIVDMAFRIEYTEEGEPTFKTNEGSGKSITESINDYNTWFQEQFPDTTIISIKVDQEGTITATFVDNKTGKTYDSIQEYQADLEESETIHAQVTMGIEQAFQNMKDLSFENFGTLATDLTTAKESAEGIKTSLENLEIPELSVSLTGEEGESTDALSITVTKINADASGATVTFDPEFAPIVLGEAKATATSVIVSTTAAPQLEGFTNESGGLTFNLGDSVTGKTATLTITPTNYVTDISGATPEEITEDVKATASTATVAATSYTVTLTNQDGSTTSVVVDGTANLQAVINGLTQNAEGQYSLPDVTGEAKVDAEVLAAQTKIDGLFEKTYELNFTVNATTVGGSSSARDGLNGKNGFITNTAGLKDYLQVSVDELRGYLAVGSQGEENILTYWSDLLSELANGNYDMSNLEDDITTLQQLQEVLAMEGGQNTNLPLVENVETLKTSMEGLKDKNGVKNMQQVAMIAQQLMGMDLQSIATFMTNIADSANIIVTLDFSNFAGLHTTVESVASQIQTIVDSLTGLNGQTITVNVVQNTGGPTGGSTGGGKTDGNNNNGSGGSGQVSPLDTSGLAASISYAQTLLGNLSGAIDKLHDKSNEVSKTAAAIDKLKSKTVKVNAPSNISIGATMSATISLSVPPGSTAKVDYSVGAGDKKSSMSVTKSGGPAIMPSAKGNVALARGTFGRAMAGGSKKTLMGELGPELVVSKGSYHLVGENGAEFVNLPNDAIVFNHLQTQDLLKRGNTSHGKPVISARESVALAGGNVSGPAKADASAALAELKRIREMWQSLLDASMQDLGKKGGSGGGGGGGGGGSGNDYWGVAHDLQRWYNLLRQIANEEQKITYEQAKRKNMNSGYDYSDSLQKELDLLKQQRAQYQELATLQKKYYDQRRKDLEDSEYAKIFTYNEEGLLQYTEGENRGLEMLSKLNETDKNGALVFKTAGEQIKKLASMGFDTSSLYVNDDGSKIKKDEEGHQKAMQNFWDRTDTWRDEIDGLWDEYHDHMIKVEENTSKIDEILQEYIDNQLSIEDKLLKAIEDQRQAEIDKLEDLKEATQNAADKYTDGLSKALQKEQDMYNKNQTDQETARLQRQLAILQRSGGSASEIKNLQNQIDDAMKTSYFDAMQKQIDAIQEASDKEIERMETQIDLMNKSLEYEKENGLLWEQVYEMMNNWTPEKMLDFIEAYTKEYAENSGLKNAEDSKATKKELEIWTADRDQKARDQEWENYYSGTGSKYSNTVKEEFGEQAHEAFNNAYKENGGSASDTSVSAATAAADKILSDAQQAEDERNKQPEPEVTPAVEEPKNEGMIEYLGGKGQYYTYASSKTSKKGAIFHGNGKSPKVELLAEEGSRYQIRGKDGDGHSFDGVWISKKNSKGKALWKKYAEGGMVDYTGPAWVDGTKQKPEAFINAETTALLKDYVFSNKNNSLLSSIATIQETAANMRSALSSTGDNNTSIGDISITFETGTISNDYDARRAGQNAMEEILKIAKQSGNIGLSRR